MSGLLDLSRRPEDARAETEADLKARLAATLDLAAQRLVLAACPDTARQAVWAGERVALVDRTADGVLALDSLPVEVLTLLRLGAPSAPLAVLVCVDQDQAETLQARLAPAPTCLLKAGLDALSPGARQTARTTRAERDAILARSAAFIAEEIGSAVVLTGDGLRVEVAEPDRLAALGLTLAQAETGWTAFVPDAAAARRLEQFLGLKPALRAASVRRTTKETDIALTVDLDGEGGAIDTGVHFFDHMLEQIARHGGIGLEVSCVGDVEVDAHHTVEDVCLALGEALREALGDKRGIARFGFELPMDETRAGVWIDLSGRPYAVFEGAIPGDRVGDFPVEMCAHAFRSLSESMKAAVHVKVDGENAHHMIESCFKAFGRALRMAVRIEGEALPSTKGVL